MKKMIAMLVMGLGSVSTAFAGDAAGFSTFQISWSGSAPAPTAVPTMSTYGTLLLAVLLALVVYRILRNRGSLVRAIAPLATLGVLASFAVISERPIAGIPSPPVDASSCNGTTTYTASVLGGTPPPCFYNTCGAEVAVSYTFVAGEMFDGTTITQESCILEYACGEGDPDPAAQGATIPSDGIPYGTAYCQTGPPL